MAITKVQKTELLTELEQALAEAKGVVFVRYQGIKVKDLELIRKSLRGEGVSLRVTKNTILKLALQKHGIEIDETILNEPIVMASSQTDEIAPAKTLKNFLKEIEVLKVMGGIVSGRFLTAAEVVTLSSLPGREELYAKLVGITAAPMTGLLRVLQGPMSGLVSVLKQYQNQLIRN